MWRKGDLWYHPLREVRMKMIYRDSSGTVILDEGGVTGRRIHQQNGCEYVQLTVQPGSVVAPHSLPFPVTFYVSAGAALLRLGDARYEVGKGDLLEVEADVSREWQNIGAEALSLLVIKHTG
jgi:quercetin dioxygenase-like cupin family protein